MEKKIVNIYKRLDDCCLEKKCLTFLKNWETLYNQREENRPKDFDESNQIDWCHAYYWYPLVTIRDLCRLRKESILSIKGAGRSLFNRFDDLLEEYGLHWGMDDEDIENYEIRILISNSQGVKKEIDWEERFWKLAHELYLKRGGMYGERLDEARGIIMSYRMTLEDC